MGTVATIGARVARKLRDPNYSIYSKANIIDQMNEALELIYAHLQNLESKFVYSHTTMATVDGTAEYSFATSHSGFLRDGVWLDEKTNYLQLVTEPDRVDLGYEDNTDEGEPFYYYFDEDGKIGLIPTPDAIYTVHIYYWKPLTALALAAGDFPTSDFAWNGIWNDVITRLVVSELSDIRELATGRNDVMLQNLWDQATARTFQFGVRRRRLNTGFFDDIEGV